MINGSNLAPEKVNLHQERKSHEPEYTIELSEEERQHLEELTSSGIASVRTVKRAQILLKSDSRAEGMPWKYDQICAAFNITPVTVLNIRKSFVEKGGQPRYIVRNRNGSTNMLWTVRKKRI